MSEATATEVELLEAQRTAALALHQPAVLPGGEGYCESCMKPDNASEYEPWPCPTAKALGVTS